ncbi:hypothetical protein EX30DRAFT_343010 [Ascodesmis nigricans]|uniref:Uncharacterized protein n=1 Tax=Ascodesmis nigricans TaxID=341454 RepID=A0A4S2MNJ6_9PEZI|nr:hypothetical protein EX30DRAFT_343010 [Ascodesmis nigricans]
MRFTLLTTLSLLSALVAAHPTAESSLQKREDQVQTATLVFHGAPVEYTLQVPADGSVVETNNDINVNIIDANDYHAFTNCQFTFGGPQQPTLVQSIDNKTGKQSIIVGPPAPVVSVSCQGMCVPVYGMCYGFDNQWIGPCCNGFCAATRCRPWIAPGNVN